jgi:hypothetical protein
MTVNVTISISIATAAATTTKNLQNSLNRHHHHHNSAKLYETPLLKLRSRASQFLALHCLHSHIDEPSSEPMKHVIHNRSSGPQEIPTVHTSNIWTVIRVIANVTKVQDKIQKNSSEYRQTDRQDHSKGDSLQLLTDKQ